MSLFKRINPPVAREEEMSRRCVFCQPRLQSDGAAVRFVIQHWYKTLKKESCVWKKVWIVRHLSSFPTLWHLLPSISTLLYKFAMQTTPVVYCFPSKSVDIHINYEHIRFLTGGLRWQTCLRLGRLMLMVVWLVCLPCGFYLHWINPKGHSLFSFWLNVH